MMKSEERREYYLKRAEKYSQLESVEEKRLFYLSVLRFVTFIGGFVLIYFGFLYKPTAGLLLIPAVTVMFLYLLILYSSHSRKKSFYSSLSIINLNEAGAVSGDLSPFEAGNSYIDTGHDFSNDVDLFGNSSLFQYLNRTVTGYGRDILAGWLSNPYPLASELTSRQDAVSELAAKDNWRQEFLAHGMKKVIEKSDVATLLKWMEEGTIIRSSTVKLILIWVLPAITLLSLLLVASGTIHYSIFTFIFLANLLFVSSGLRKINKIHNDVSGKYNYLSSMDELLKAFNNESFDSKILNSIKLNVSGKKVSAAIAVKKLGRLIQAFDSRMNFIVGFMLNGLLLWDYHSIYRLEKWKAEYKELFPTWLEMLGRIDALISLGNYAFNNPHFVYPVISDGNRILSALKLGHPLIDEKQRICNDFSLERSGTVCIISGANMAGKSTFQRTVAVNYILGMAGAPVCADKMEFTTLQLFTSMRTTDSLSHNESYFYAELKRLKVLKSRIENGEKILFILDEILKGTNSADKSLGSRLFLQKLVRLGGTGLIATHDISLGELENDYPGVIINKCFEIEIEGETINFDYKLQEGITHKMNAAFLMKQMGIIE